MDVHVECRPQKQRGFESGERGLLGGRRTLLAVWIVVCLLGSGLTSAAEICEFSVLLFCPDALVDPGLKCCSGGGVGCEFTTIGGGVQHFLPSGKGGQISSAVNGRRPKAKGLLAQLDVCGYFARFCQDVCDIFISWLRCGSLCADF